jgi:hypothetical protein
MGNRLWYPGQNIKFVVSWGVAARVFSSAGILGLFFSFLQFTKGFPTGPTTMIKKGAQLHHPDPDRYRPAIVSNQNTDTVMPPPERVTCGARLSGLAERLTAAEKQLEQL